MDIHGVPYPQRVPHAMVSHLEFVEQVLLRSAVDWSSASASFTILIRLLETDPFRTKLLEGLAVSIGDSTESLARHSWASFESYIAAAGDQVPPLHHACHPRGCKPEIAARHRVVPGGCKTVERLA